MRNFYSCSFPTEDLESPSQGTTASYFVLGLEIALCPAELVMDGHQMKAAHKKMGCNSSAQSTGQHKGRKKVVGF